MQRLRMVPVIRVTGAFHARVIVARLGAEGIVTQTRGGIDTPYPMGAVEVLVSEDELEDAKAILLTDEIESAFDEFDDDDEIDGEPSLPRRRVHRLVFAALALLLVISDIVVVAYR